MTALVVLAIYTGIAACVLVIGAAALVLHPDSAPGGGALALLAFAIAWPVLLMVALIGAVFHALDPGNWR